MQRQQPPHNRPDRRHAGRHEHRAHHVAHPLAPAAPRARPERALLDHAARLLEARLFGAEQRELEPRPRRGRQLAHDHIERRLHARRVGKEHGRDARLVALLGDGGLLDRGVERADRLLVLGHAVRVAALDHIEHAPVDRLKVLVARLDRRLARLDQLPRRLVAHALGARGDLGGHHLIHHDELRTQRADGLLGVWGARHAQLELVQQGARFFDGFGLGQRRKATERLGQLDRVLVVAAFRGRRRLDGAQRLGRPLLKRPERFGHLGLGLELRLHPNAPVAVGHGTKHEVRLRRVRVHGLPVDDGRRR